MPNCKSCGEVKLVVAGELICPACDDEGVEERKTRMAAKEQEKVPMVKKAGAQSAGWPEAEHQRRKA